MRALAAVPFALVALVGLSGCPPEIQLNRAYHPRAEGPPALAVVPISIDDPESSDAAFTSAFTKRPGPFTLVPLSRLRERVDADAALKSALIKVAMAPCDGDDLSSAPGLVEIAGTEGLASIRSGLGGADLMLFPVRLGFRALPGSASGAMTYRLYDLRDGRIVFQHRQQLRINVPGKKGDVLLLFVFAAAARRDFDDHFLQAR